MKNRWNSRLKRSLETTCQARPSHGIPSSLSVSPSSRVGKGKIRMRSYGRREGDLEDLIQEVKLVELTLTVACEQC